MTRETNFIRGKSPKVVANESSVIKTSTDSSKTLTTDLAEDALFNVRKRKQNDWQTVTKGKKKKNKKRNDEEMVTNDDNVVIETMSLSALPEGMVIYGCIQQISDFEIKFSLVSGIIATVSITNISNSYTRLLQSLADNQSIVSDMEVLKPNGMFKIGQYFPIKILSISKKLKSFKAVDVMASMNPKDIYKDIKISSLLKVPQIPIIAAVDSVEDHGFVMDIGFDKIKAFLPKDKSETDRKTLSAGMLVLCAIDRVVSDRSITLTTNSKVISKFKLKSDSGVIASVMTPGLIVKATVMNVKQHGLEVNILDEFKGFVTRSFLKNEWDLPKNMYQIGDQIEGIILYRHPITKHFALSLKPKYELKVIKSFLQNNRIGTIYDESVVLGKDNFRNIIFKLSNGVKALAHKKDLSDKVSEDTDFDTLYSIGSKHRCRAKAINLMDMTVTVTLKQTQLSASSLTIDDLDIGSIVKGNVKKVTKDGVVVYLGFGLKGFIPNIHLTEVSQIHNREQLFTKGREIKCRVFKMDKNTTPFKVSLTCKKSLLSKKLRLLTSYEEAVQGFQTDGVIALVLKTGILIEFFNGVKGFVPLKFLSTNAIQSPENLFTVGQIIRCSVVRTDPITEKMTCTLITDKTKKVINADPMTETNINFEENSEELTKQNKNRSKRESDDYLSLNLFNIGTIVNGKVQRVTSAGVDIDLEVRGVKGFVPAIHLSDNTDDSQQVLTIGKSIKCRVYKIELNSSPRKLYLTCKKSLLSESLNLLNSYEKAVKNFQTDGVIGLIHKKGLLIEFFNNVKGFIPYKHLNTFKLFKDSPEKIFTIGQIVRCRVVKTDVNKKKMTCKLMNIENYQKNNNKIENTKPKPKCEDVLKLDEPFVWNVDNSTPNLNRLDSLTDDQPLSESEDSDDNCEDESPKRKKTRRERNEQSRLNEQNLRTTERLLMDTQRKPETVDDFERSLFASPNSSLVWLKYIAFYLEQTEVTKARELIQRALKTVSFREEKERLNIWFASINLENLYGTQQTLDDVFENAVQFNEPFIIYNHLVNTYTESNKLEEAELLYNTMLKKFKHNKDVWINFGLFYMKSKRFESARKLMQRSLTCLEKRYHIDVISKFAQMEFKLADIELGKTLFENILANFPKRIDLWSVYIDMMIKCGVNDDKSNANENEEMVRNIFERVITFKLAAKQMKFIFKRYIDFETQLNNFERIDRIKQKAIEYIEGKTLSID